MIQFKIYFILYYFRYMIIKLLDELTQNKLIQFNIIQYHNIIKYFRHT